MPMELDIGQGRDNSLPAKAVRLLCIAVIRFIALFVAGYIHLVNGS